MPAQIGLYGLNAKSNISNPFLQQIIQEITSYNGLAGANIPNKSKMLLHLDNAMVAAAKWLTAKPKTATTTNRGRWTALENVTDDIAQAIKDIGYGTLFGSFKAPSAENYWLERIDPQHRPGFALSKHYARWQASGTAGIDFFSWLDNDLKVSAEAAENALTMANLPGEPLSDAESRQLSTAIADYKRAQQHVAMFDTSSRTQYRLSVGSDACLHDTQERFCTKNHETHFSGKGWAVYVVAPGNTIYSYTHKVGQFHHSSFLSGETVVAAGEIVTDEFGKVLVVTGKSGHYRPTIVMIWRFVQFLKGAGVLSGSAVVQPGFGASWAHAADFATKKHQARPMNGAAAAAAALPKWARNSPKVLNDIVGDTGMPTAFNPF